MLVKGKIKISKIENKDIKKAKEFCLGIFEELNWPKKFAYGFENLKDFFSGKREVYLLAKLKDKIIGCGGLKELSKDEGLVKRFYIAKEFRGKGLAEEILKKIKQFAKKKNYQTIVLDIFEGNERAKKFFQKQGFIVFNPSAYKNWVESKHPETFELRKLEL